MDDMIYESRKNKITFSLDKKMPMMVIDMSKLSWWKRTFKRKEFVLWDCDIKSLKEFISAYETCKETNLTFY